MFLHSFMCITTLVNLRFPFALCLDSESGLFYPANGFQLEIRLVNVTVSVLPSIPCDISPVFLDLPVVMCRTRYTCLEMRRYDRTSALLISVVFGGKLEQHLLWLQLPAIALKNVPCEYSSLKVPIKALWLLGK